MMRPLKSLRLSSRTASSGSLLLGLTLGALISACSGTAARPDGGSGGGSGPIGAHCGANSDCASDQCSSALGFCVSSCSSSGSCPTGTSCAQPDGGAGSLCLPACSSNGDCNSGDVCDPTQKVCLPQSPTDAGGCQTTGCGTGQTCDTSTGQCVAASTSCTTTGCATGQTCDSATGQCVTATTSCETTGCSTGQTCDTTTGQCVTSTTSCTTTGCSTGQTCDTTTGQCVTAATGPLTNTGAACASPSDCMGGTGTLCLSATSPSYFAGGYCTATCLTDNDCGSGGICVMSFFQSSTGAEPYCMKSCTSSSDCRSGYICAADGTQNFCLPDDCRVDDSLCTWTQVCNQATGACGPPPVTAGYPATFPAPPQVAKSNGPVLANPKIVAIFFSNDSEASTLAAFYTGFPKTQLWAALSEYGVGAGTTTVVNLAEAAPTTIDDSGSNSALEKWLLADIAAGKLPEPDANTEYMINYPDTTTISSDGSSGGASGCLSFGGYHVDMKNTGGGGVSYIAYGVIPRCPASGGFTVDQNFTSSASHEVIEAATDPYPNYEPAWAQADDAHIDFDEGNGGSEVGDMCENDPEAYYQFTDLPFVVQRFWSNSSAAAGHDPCVPYYDGEVYFNSVPATPDTISFKYGGTSYSVGGTKIAVGASGTVTVDLYSDQPTSDWTVGVQDYDAFFAGQTALLTITAPTVVTGQNGAQLQFSVKVDTKGGTANGNVAGTELFVVTSTQGTGSSATEHFWFGVIGQQ